jgi:hypothetical protein
MLWAALLPPRCSDDERRTDAVGSLGTWCLQFTPRVSLVEPSTERSATSRGTTGWPERSMAFGPPLLSCPQREFEGGVRVTAP